MYRLLDLFSGIGGFSLGLERSGGFKTVAFCEIDPYCRKVLAKHWPDVLCYEDIRTLTADRLAADGIGIDAVCGGFPCQDISVAGKGAGIEGERSGLWSEYARIIGELRPRYVFVENVAALLSRGLDRVLGDLASLGFDAEWHCIPASAVGAPHRRDRLWIVAHATGGRQSSNVPDQYAEPSNVDASGSVADANVAKRWPLGEARYGLAFAKDSLSQRQEGSGGLGSGRQDVAHTSSSRREGLCSPIRVSAELARFGGARWWSVEPDVGRVAHGVPKRVDRLRALGNAVVPQIPELLGRAVLAAEGQPC